MICVYIYSILLHIMHIFTNRFLVLSESKADIHNQLSLLAYSAFKWSIHQSMMIVICLRP